MKQKKPTLFNKIGGTLLTGILSLSSMYMVYIYFGLLLEGITNQEDIIIFAKTAMYALGTTFFFLPMFIVFIFLLLFNKEVLTVAYKEYTKYMLFVPFIITFIFPQIVSFVVFYHIEKINYIECSEQSTYEFRFTKYVFAKDLETCQTYEE